MTTETSPQSPIGITAEPSRVDPHTYNLIVDREVHPGGPHGFESPERAQGSPLPERLFGLGGVESVVIAGNVITVKKKTDTPWEKLLGPMGAVIRSQLLSGAPALVERSLRPHEGPLDDAEIARIVEELLERELNPQIASHSGSIHLERVEDGTVFVRMTGGCQGCAASNVTLSRGLEVVVKRVLPEVQIVDVTDHGAGQKPFFELLPPEMKT